MPDHIKRLHYYDQQFLRVNDFGDEQNYNRNLRLLHNRSLHTWGVVNGFAVAKTVDNDNEVTISSGMALDKAGQEIVLLQSHKQAAQTSGDQDRFVIARFTQEQTDEPPPQDRISDTDKTRWTEGVAIDVVTKEQLLTESPPKDVTDKYEIGVAIILARIKFESGRISRIEGGEYPYHRRLANVNGHFSRDGIGECCSGGDFTLSVAEATRNQDHTIKTGRRSTIQFHNGWEAEGFIRLAALPGSQPKKGDGTPIAGSQDIATRRFIFGSYQEEMAGEFTGDLYVKGSIGIGTASVGAELVVSRSDRGATVLVDGNGGTYGLFMGADVNHPWIGSRTNHGLRIVTNAKEQVRITEDGKVGIGTHIPSAPLHVRGNQAPDPNSAQARGLLHIGGGNDVFENQYLIFPNPSTRDDNGMFWWSSDMVFGREKNVFRWALKETHGGNLGSSLKDIIKATVSDEGGYVHLNNIVLAPDRGNVGIGTTQPGIQGDPQRTFLTIMGTKGAGVLETATNEADGNGVRLGLLQFTDKNSTASDKRGAVIASSLEGNTNNNRGGRLEFHTKADNGLLAERMRIDSKGNVGIGATSSGRKLVVDGNVSIYTKEGSSWGEGLRIISTGSNTHAATFYGREDADTKALWFTGISAFPGPDKNKEKELESDLIFLSGPGRAGLDSTQFKTSSLNEYRNDAVMVLQHSTGNALFGAAIVPSAGNSESSGILFPKDAWTGHGDRAWIRYYSRGGEATTFEIGTSNDADDHIALMASGGVGIGTAEPSHKFHVKAQDAVGLFESTGTQAYLRLSTNEGLDNRVEITNRAGGRLSLWTAGADDVFNILRDGRVGIGTTNPDFALQVGNKDKPGSSKLCVAGRGSTGNWRQWTFRTGDGATAEEIHKFRIRDEQAAKDRIVIGEFGKVDIDGSLELKGSFVFPNTGEGSAALISTTYDNENVFKKNNVKLSLGHQLSPSPEPEYEFIIGHSFRQFQSGKPPINRFIWKFRIAQDGDLYCSGSKDGYVVDYFLNRVGETLEQGDVVIIGKHQTSHYSGTDNNIPLPEVDLTDKVYDSRVCGIVARVVMENELPYVELEPTMQDESKKGMRRKSGNVQSDLNPLRQFAATIIEDLDKTKVQDKQMGKMVTLGAFAHCKVDADIAPIEVGDLLTTSTTKGHAQKVLEPEKAVGSIIGKGLASLKKGKGKIPILVLLQ